MDLKITYPVAIDSKYTIWNAFHNEYWPAHYFIDAQGQIRYHHFGEGKYDESEEVIQQLLREKDASLKTGGLVQVNAAGVQAAADTGNVKRRLRHMSAMAGRKIMLRRRKSQKMGSKPTRLRRG